MKNWLSFEMEAEECTSIQDFLPEKSFDILDIPNLLKGYMMLRYYPGGFSDPVIWGYPGYKEVRKDTATFKMAWPLDPGDMPGNVMSPEYQAFMNSGDTVFLRMENYMEYAETRYKLRFLSNGKVVPVVHAFPCYKKLVKLFREDAGSKGWMYRELETPDVQYYVYALYMHGVNAYVTDEWCSYTPTLYPFDPEEHNAQLGWRTMYTGSRLYQMLGITYDEDYENVPGINIDYQVVISLHPLDDVFRVEV